MKKIFSCLGAGTGVSALTGPQFIEQARKASSLQAQVREGTQRAEQERYMPQK
jgi:hypothetical protein